MKISKIIFFTVFLYIVTNNSYAISVSDFIPFGTDVGNTELSYKSDQAVTITDYISMPIFGEHQSSLILAENGHIMLGGNLVSSGNSAYTPRSFPLNNYHNNNKGVIAPYWGDVDTSDGGAIYYGSLTDSESKSSVSDLINSASSSSIHSSFHALSLFVATWDQVSYYDLMYSEAFFKAKTEHKNTFQAAIASDGFATYAIFNYDWMYWETGSASKSPYEEPYYRGLGGIEAGVGFDVGDGTNYYAVPGSMEAGISQVVKDGSNIGVAGQWLFRIDGTEVILPDNPNFGTSSMPIDIDDPIDDPLVIDLPVNTVPEPTTILLFLFGLIGLIGVRRKN